MRLEISILELIGIDADRDRPPSPLGMGSYGPPRCKRDPPGAFDYRSDSIPTKHLTKTKTDPYGSAFVFGADRDRTDYLLNAIQSL